MDFPFLALTQPPVQEIDFGMMLLRMIFFLALIVLLIYFLLRKVLPFLVQPQTYHQRTIHLIERVPVDQKRALLVVEVQGKYLLLGSSEGQISVLMELDKEQMNIRQESIKSVSFEQILRRTFGKPKKMEDG